ncbi:folylpolyglutamate synthase/dihydrofolate synthase [Chelatococcus sambhunathii]|uniref:Dihydrofolate synthase/folylpolyglutamate synthase n=2 Tax=Chelatococcus TaxID=28209 RepID=A0AAC9NXB6_9HYPH|nr:MULTISPECIES: folylpolyglutamate synthase/dihydrofolate synthase family protein [Chelatococcus]APF36082.1 bifunctional folylpolyglutamate synthase/dihydrofolate synthase [Chelatococcus daeguensis]CUA88744.1 folylpolyglutamate synthase/dihydrofolate synthase [Chelatococcus sambhunathii]
MESSDAMLARFLALHPKTIDLSLGRIERLLTRLGAPQRQLPPVIHVAGTNGKGSTIAFMRAVLEAAGLVVHVYTSPHLVRFHERIRLGRPGGGRFVGEDRLVAALERCEDANGGAPITVFEITTAAAMLLFAETPADVLLLEVGLGGRLDATNVVETPQACVVTPVSLDHADYLGDNVMRIAAEKAGIFKRGAPAIIAPQEPEPTAVLEAAAERVGARSILVGGQDFHVHEERGRLVYQDEQGLIDLPLPRLAGRHQLVNAGTALATLRAAGYGRLPAEAFEAGMSRAEWPARMQRLRQGSLVDLAPDGAELWLDGGHNPDGGRALAAAFAELEERHPAPLVMIVGMLGTKDADGFLKPFVGLAQELIAVPIPSQLAARPAEEVAGIARSVGLQARASDSVEAALAGLRATERERPPRILVTGSLYLAGDVLAANGTLPQ